MVIDAEGRDFAKSELTGRVLNRVDVVGRPVAQKVFALCDALLAQDKRIEELLGGWSMIEHRIMTKHGE